MNSPQKKNTSSDSIAGFILKLFTRYIYYIDLGAIISQWWVYVSEFLLYALQYLLK